MSGHKSELGHLPCHAQVTHRGDDAWRDDNFGQGAKVGFSLATARYTNMVPSCHFLMLGNNGRVGKCVILKRCDLNAFSMLAMCICTSTEVNMALVRSLLQRSGGGQASC